MRRNTLLETLTAIAFLGFMGVFMYYAFYPFSVTTLNSIAIDKAEYCRGEWVNVEMDFIKHIDAQAEIKWFIVDGVVYQLDSPGVTRPAGQNIITVAKQVPHSILPGDYNLRIEMEYKIHPLHNPITTTWNTPKFKVVDEPRCDNVDETYTPILPTPEPETKPQPSPQPYPELYPAFAEGSPTPQTGSNTQYQEQVIVVPDGGGEPQPEPQTPLPPEDSEDQNQGLIREVLKRTKDLLK